MPKLKYAIILALGTALISGTNNFLTKIAVKAVADPVVFTFLKNAIVAVILIGIFLLFKKWNELKELNRKDVIKLLSIGAIGGSIPFILFFTGLSLIPAINAAFIHKTLFIWVALLAVPILKERVGKWPLIALMLLFVGNLTLFGLPKFNFGAGELMVLAATLFWAIENVIAKIALRNISSQLVAGARMTVGSIIILGVIIFQGNIGMLSGLSPIQWGWTLLTGVLLAGYVLTWYTALKHAPAILVASLLVLATFVTNILNAMFLTNTLSLQQLLSGLLLLIGAGILIARARYIVSPINSRVATTSNELV